MTVPLADFKVLGPVPGEVVGMLFEPGPGQRIAATELVPVGVVPSGAASAVALSLALRPAAGSELLTCFSWALQPGGFQAIAPSKGGESVLPHFSERGSASVRGTPEDPRIVDRERGISRSRVSGVLRLSSPAATAPTT